MKILSFLAAVLLSISCAGVAQAQRMMPASWYGSVIGDVTFANDSDVKGVVGGKVRYNTSGGVNIALGYQPDSPKGAYGRFRVEMEGGYHNFVLDTVTAGLVTNTNPSDMEVWTIMGNVYYDFDTSYEIKPYVGVGIGDAFVHMPRNSGLGNTENTDSKFAYQLMAGVAYSPKAYPATNWIMGYRYFNAGTAEYSTVGGKVKVDDIESSNLELGLRYHF